MRRKRFTGKRKRGLTLFGLADEGRELNIRQATTLAEQARQESDPVRRAACMLRSAERFAELAASEPRRGVKADLSEAATNLRDQSLVALDESLDSAPLGWTLAGGPTD